MAAPPPQQPPAPLQWTFLDSPYTILPLVQRFPRNSNAVPLENPSAGLGAQRDLAEDFVNSNWDDLWQHMVNRARTNRQRQIVANDWTNVNWLRDHSARITLHSPDAITPINRSGVGNIIQVRLPLYTALFSLLFRGHYTSFDAVFSFCVIRSGELYFLDMDLGSLNFHAGRRGTGTFSLDLPANAAINGNAYRINNGPLQGEVAVMAALYARATHPALQIANVATNRELGSLYLLFACLVTNLLHRRHVLIPRRSGSVTRIVSHIDLEVGDQFVSVVDVIDANSGIDQIFTEVDDQQNPPAVVDIQAARVIAEHASRLWDAMIDLVNQQPYQGGALQGVLMSGLRIILNRDVGELRIDPDDPNATPPVINALPLLALDFGGCYNRDHHFSDSYIAKWITTVDVEAVKLVSSHHNCGLREIIAQVQQLPPCAFRNNWKMLADVSNALREEGWKNTQGNASNDLDNPFIPRVGPLHPTHLWSCCVHSESLSQYVKSLTVLISPHMSRKTPLQLHYEREEEIVYADAPRHITLVLSGGHYYSIMAEHVDEFKESFMKHIYCEKCRKAVLKEHECKPIKGKTISVLDETNGKRKKVTLPPKRDSPEAVRSNILYPPKTAKGERMAPHESLLFMDYETRRVVDVVDKSENHQVYAFGVSTGKKDDPVHRYFGEDADLQSVKWLRDYMSEYKIGDLWLNQERAATLYFYNGSRFDFLFLLEAFAKIGVFPDKDGERCGFTLKNGQILSATFFGGALVLRDLCLLTLCSLKDACKNYGVDDDESKDDFDHELIKSPEDYQRYKDELDRYLELDIISMRAVFHSVALEMSEFKFRDDNGVEQTLGGVDITKRITLSHAAFDIWLHTLPLIKESFPHILQRPRTVEEDALWRRAYYGGRVFPGVAFWESDEFKRLLDAWLLRSDGNFDGRQWRQLLINLLDHAIDLDVVSLYPTSMRGSDALMQALGHRIIGDFFCGDNFTYVVEKNSEWDSTLFASTGYLSEAKNKTTALKEQNTAFACRNFILGFQQRIELLSTNQEWIEAVKRCPQREIDNYANSMHSLAYKHNTMGGIVHCSVTPPKDLVTELLPYKKDGKLVWTLDKHENTSLVIDELLHAIVYGYRVKKNEIYAFNIWTRRVAIFKIFVDIMFDRKANALTEAGKQIAKRLLNSCYGKTIQQIITEVVEIISHEWLANYDLKDLKDVIPVVAQPRKRTKRSVHNLPTEETREYLDVLGDRVVESEVLAWVMTKENKKARSTKPINLGLQVTAFARMIMNCLLYNMNALNDMFRQMMYTDTDSLIMHAREVRALTTLSNMFIGKLLGQLSDELKGGLIVKVLAVSPKFYNLVFLSTTGKLLQKIRCKGFPHPSCRPHNLHNNELDDTHASFWPVSHFESESSCFTVFDSERQEYVTLRVGSDIPARWIDVQEPFVLKKNMHLKDVVFEVCWNGGERWLISHMSWQVFEGLLTRRVDWVTVHFVAMKRRFFNETPSTRVANISHLYLSRTVRGIAWWDSPDCPRKLDEFTGVALPAHTSATSVLP
jgi:hypothetical protein